MQHKQNIFAVIYIHRNNTSKHPATRLFSSFLNLCLGEQWKQDENTVLILTFKVQHLRNTVPQP